MNFESFGLEPQLLRAVENAGYTTPSPIQAAAIPAVLEKNDVLGCAQTGTGKTAAFSLPIINRLLKDKVRGVKRHIIRSLILSPTRELTAQIADNISKYARRTKIRTTTVFGGVSQYWQVKELERGIDILVATPGRLLDLMNQGHVDLGWVEMLVLDEADHMLDMGFLPDVKRIIEKVPDERQTMLFSATMPGPIRELANRILKSPVSIRIEPEKPTTDLVDQRLCMVAQPKKPDLLRFLIDKHPDGPMLIFARTKHSADQLVKKLARTEIHAEAIHGNKTQASRQRTLDAFKDGRTRILVATDIAARGIDVSGIEFVVNYDLPMAPETYVHRIGRTGRAGKNGIAYSFCGAHETNHLRSIHRHLGNKIPIFEEQPNELVEQLFETESDRDRPKRNSRNRNRGRERGSNEQRPRQRASSRDASNSRGTTERRPNKRNAANFKDRKFERGSKPTRSKSQRPNTDRPNSDRPNSDRRRGERHELRKTEPSKASRRRPSRPGRAERLAKQSTKQRTDDLRPKQNRSSRPAHSDSNRKKKSSSNAFVKRASGNDISEEAVTNREAARILDHSLGTKSKTKKVDGRSKRQPSTESRRDAKPKSASNGTFNRSKRKPKPGKQKTSKSFVAAASGNSYETIRERKQRQRREVIDAATKSQSLRRQKRK